MKALLMTFWVLVGLLVGLGFGGYIIPKNQWGDPDRVQQWWNLLIGAGVGVGCGFGVANAILEQTKD